MTQLTLIPESPPKSKIRKVVLTELPPNDKLYCAPPPQGMLESMRVVGQLQAVGVIENKSGGYSVCWGRKRIVTARKLGWISIEAKVYEPGMSAQALMTLVENEQRRESLEVKMTAVEQCRLSVPEDDLCKLIGVPKSAFKQILALIDGLIPELRQALREGRMAQGTALKVIRLSQKQQEELAQLEKIRAQDVEKLLQAKMGSFLEQLPDVLFEIPSPVSWEDQVRTKLKEIAALIPSDRGDLLQPLERLNECLDRELLAR